MEDAETEKRKKLLEARDCFAVEGDKVALTSEQLLMDDDAGRALSSAVCDPEEEEEDDDDAEADPEMSVQQDITQGNRKEKKGSVKEDNKISRQLGFNRYLRDNIWKVGAKRIRLDDLGNKRKRRKK